MKFDEFIEKVKNYDKANNFTQNTAIKIAEKILDEVVYDIAFDDSIEIAKQKLKRESESENASLTPTLYRVTRRYHRMRGYCIKATDPDHAKVIARRDFTEITETEPLDVEEW